MGHSDPTLKYVDVPYHISSEIASVFSLNSKIKNASGGLKLLAATVCLHIICRARGQIQGEAEETYHPLGPCNSVFSFAFTRLYCLHAV